MDRKVASNRAYSEQSEIIGRPKYCRQEDDANIELCSKQILTMNPILYESGNGGLRL